MADGGDGGDNDAAYDGDADDADNDVGGGGGGHSFACIGGVMLVGEMLTLVWKAVGIQLQDSVSESVAVGEGGSG